MAFTSLLAGRVVLVVGATDGLGAGIARAAAREGAHVAVSGRRPEKAQSVADELTGTISNIDLTRNTFQLEGKTFTASPTNTVGAKLSDLMDGDKVTVEAAEIETGKQPINVMRLEKAE